MLLRAACARAQGTLEVLDVTGWRGLFDVVDEVLDVTGCHFDEVDEEDETLTPQGLTTLLPILQANAGSLVELRAWHCFDQTTIDYCMCVEGFEALLSAAPLLRLLECDCYCGGEEAATNLRRLEEPQFSPLRLRGVSLHGHVTFLLDVPAAAAKIALHTSLMRLELHTVALDTEPALDAVVNLAVSQLQHLTMRSCRLSPASLPALTRMLGSSSLTELFIEKNYGPLLVGAAVPAFCAALRASRLVELTLESVDLWGSLEDGLAVIAACTRHPTLRTLDFKYNGLKFAAGHEAIEAALDALESSSNAELSVTREGIITMRCRPKYRFQ